MIKFFWSLKPKIALVEYEFRRNEFEALNGKVLLSVLAAMHK